MKKLENYLFALMMGFGIGGVIMVFGKVISERISGDLGNVFFGAICVFAMVAIFYTIRNFRK